MSQINVDNDSEYICSAVNDWRLLSGVEELLDKFRHIQKAWDTRVVDKVFAKLFSSFAEDPVHPARLLGQKEKESAAWLNALSARQLSTQLDDTVLQIAVALRLGGIFCSPFKCICGSEMDKFGHPPDKIVVCCGKSPGRYRRHRNVLECQKRSLHEAGYSAMLEPPHLMENSSKRPDGKTLYALG